MRETRTLLTRRHMLGGLASWLAVGVTQGCLKNQPRTNLSFIVMNDLHHAEPACDAWFSKLFHQMNRHEGIAFCAGLGDFAHRGSRESLLAVKRLSGILNFPMYPCPGNHDQEKEKTPLLYEECMGYRRNHLQCVNDWQCLFVDTTEQDHWSGTHISEHTLGWVRQQLGKLQRSKPTLVFTHFPLSEKVPMQPVNAGDFLELFKGWNLRGVFSGHHHGCTFSRKDTVELVTCACCSRVASNHDGTKEKGYWLCRADEQGLILRQFVPFLGA